MKKIGYGCLALMFLVDLMVCVLYALGDDTALIGRLSGRWMPLTMLGFWAIVVPLFWWHFDWLSAASKVRERNAEPR